MELSSALCRAQEAYQRDRAASAALESVRNAAGKAADAWGLEASAAEDREDRRARARLTAEMAARSKAQTKEKAGGLD